MFPLSIPVPQLPLDPPDAPPTIERVVNVCLAPLAFADGTALAGDAIDRIGVHLYRAAAGADEIWNDAEQRWGPAPLDLDALAPLPPLPLVFKAGAALPWQGILVAAGAKDRNGAPKIAKATGGNPRYRLRAFVEAHRDGGVYRGLSDPSADLVFASLADTQRFAVSLDTGDAQTCERARLLLKDSALAAAGFVEIRANSGREVEIASCAPDGAVRARIVLLDNGDIRLQPAPGRSIVLAGPLDAEIIRYQPQGGGPKQEL
ncbi:hypothetical protein [Aromatoleum buckelii]|uniref:Uncharacterized protein n=1 Tax=Aromatoleum buckelii TaxID=200254 RepID=A0ABX1N4Y2_9RHOO|nr:hypothetical protein [Aromatoleum buckelii]MCK0509719.1 hypothetical protein [Aromatoleum buckelii]